MPWSNASDRPGAFAMSCATSPTLPKAGTDQRDADEQQHDAPRRRDGDQ
jgi:hypothetical protein